MSSLGQLKELLVGLKESNFQVVLMVMLVVLVIAYLALVAYQRYLLSPNHDYTPPIQPNKRMTYREFEKHKKKTTEMQLARLTASAEYNKYIQKKQATRSKVQVDEDDEIVFSDEEIENSIAATKSSLLSSKAD